jgi:hypothetical protein
MKTTDEIIPVDLQHNLYQINTHNPTEAASAILAPGGVAGFG